MVICRDAEKVKASPYAFQLSQNPGKPRKVLGLDTETTDGYVTVITDSANNYTDFPTFQKGFDGDGLFEWLTMKRYRNTLNFFFNGSYDWNAIIKWLPENKERSILIRVGEVDYHGYRFHFIDKKVLSIGRIKEIHTVKGEPKLTVSNLCTYWDIAQFLTGGTLASQARNTPFPKDESFDIGTGVDTERYRRDPGYARDVVKYCIQDSKACAYLAERFVKQVYQMGVYPNSWHSKASIAKIYLRNNLKTQIKLPKGVISQHALNCTRGGLIDCYQMGIFKNVKSPDVRSCYPSVIQFLYSFNGKTSQEPEYLPDSAYSWFKVSIDYKHPYSSLLWYPQVTPEKKDLREHWHVTGEMEVWITKPEYEYFSNLGYDLKIIQASHSLKTPDTVQPFFNIMNDLWEMRQIAKKEGNPIQAVHKIVSNSVYGMMLNSWDETKFYSFEEIAKLMSDNGFETDGFKDLHQHEQYKEAAFNAFKKCKSATDFVKPINGVDTMGCHTHTTQAGTYYAPFMASHILAGARVKLCSDLQRDIDKGHVISVATDSFSLTKLSSKIDTGQKLGAWDVSTYDELLQFGAGRYLVSKDGKIDPNASAKRSIPLAPEKILELLHEYHGEESIPFHKSTPVKAKESTSARYAGKNMMNVFIEKHKDLKLLTTKRYWYEKYNKVGDIFDYNIDSRPFDITEMKPHQVI